MLWFWRWFIWNMRFKINLFYHQTFSRSKTSCHKGPTRWYKLFKILNPIKIKQLLNIYKKVLIAIKTNAGRCQLVISLRSWSKKIKLKRSKYIWSHSIPKRTCLKSTWHITTFRLVKRCLNMFFQKISQTNHFDVTIF